MVATAAKPAQEVSIPCVLPLVVSAFYSLLSCGVTTGHSVRLLNSSLKLPQIALQKRENIFILCSDCISILGGAEKAVQGHSHIRTGFPVMASALSDCRDKKIPPSNIQKLLRYCRMCFVCAETYLPEVTSQNLAYTKTILSIRKRSYNDSGKPYLIGMLWQNRNIVEFNKKLGLFFL